MKLKQKIVETFFPDVIKSKLAEAYAITGIDADDWKYRKLTGNANKDLSSLAQERMFKIAYHLYDTNPLAHRILEMTKDFVVGNGITYQAEDERVLEVLDEFWNDPVNHLDLKQHQKALELGLYGEQCYPVFVNEINGKVRLGYVDPLQIDEVITDENNAEITTHIRLKGLNPIMGQGGFRGQILKKIGPDEDPLSPTYGYLMGNDTLEAFGLGTGRKTEGVGACFFFAINKVSNATRGRSDLLSLADWIDAYDQLLFNRLDRQALMNAFIWDITLEGMDGNQIQEWLAKNPPPKPGSIRAHNERVKWEAVTPDLKAAEGEVEARLIRNQILGGAGFPSHWFADAGDANLATATAMGTPTFKRLSARQSYFRYMIEHIFKFVIDQAIIHRRLPKEINTAFSLIMPEISVNDISKLAASLQQTTATLSMAVNQEWISGETARRVFATLTSQLGVDIDPAAEAEKIAKEKGEG